MKKTALIHLYGMVQGVGLRYQVYIKANELGLKGYVNNLFDGSVKMEVEGDKQDILKLIEFIKNDMHYVRVEDMDIECSEYKGKYMDFDIH